MNVRLYVLQRATAALMVPLIAIHLVTILYAIGGGLSAKEVLARTQGSLGWGVFYGLFVLAASVHAAIGVRSVLAEWSPMRGRSLDVFMWVFGAVLMALGLRAVVAVVM